jgi:hypothetical protein
MEAEDRRKIETRRVGGREHEGWRGARSPEAARSKDELRRTVRRKKRQSAIFATEIRWGRGQADKPRQLTLHGTALWSSRA